MTVHRHIDTARSQRRAEYTKGHDINSIGWAEPVRALSFRFTHVEPLTSSLDQLSRKVQDARPAEPSVET